MNRGDPAMATTVRVDNRVHAKLLELAAEEQRPIGQVIEDAIDQYRRAKFWQGLQQDYARLRADPDAWQAYQDEVALWDTAAGDGLEREEPYYSVEEEAELDAEDARADGG
jgi:predicted transcriptional regulator